MKSHWDSCLTPLNLKWPADASKFRYFHGKRPLHRGGASSLPATLPKIYYLLVFRVDLLRYSSDNHLISHRIHQQSETKFRRPGNKCRLCVSACSETEAAIGNCCSIYSECTSRLAHHRTMTAALRRAAAQRCCAGRKHVDTVQGVRLHQLVMGGFVHAVTLQMSKWDLIKSAAYILSSYLRNYCIQYSTICKMSFVGFVRVR
jgi:hypothetical protein